MKITEERAAPNRASSSVWLARGQAGLVAGLMAVIFSISHASLVTGSVAPEATSSVIGMALVGTAVLCFVLGIFSGVKGLVPIVQDVPSAALGAILVALVSERASTSTGVTVAEIVVLCIAASLAFALALYMFGTFRLAVLMRFAPRPVLAGFLAGTGYFLISGAIGICTGEAVRLTNLPQAFTGPDLPKLLVAFAIMGGLFVGNRILPSNFAIGGVIGISVLLFHATVWTFGLTPEALTEAGWYASLPEGGLPWPPVTLTQMRGLDLRFLAEQILPLTTMIILATAALLMNTSALEAKTHSDMRLDRELKVLGYSNLVSAALGGMPGYHGVSSTLSVRRIAGAHRSITLIAGCFVLGVFLLGNSILTVLPLPIFAGFMMWVGVGFLNEWLFREMRITPPSEGWLAVAIFAIIVVFGLFQGTVFGLAAGALLFIVDYSRLDPVRGLYYGDAYHGSSEMDADQIKVLEEHGQAIAILKIQGYVFFGTAYRLRESILAITEDQPVRFIVIDFEGVTGVDATAVVSFGRISDDLQHRDCHATLTGMSEKVNRVFNRAGLQIGGTSRFERADDLNSGLSVYEKILFSEHLDDGNSEDADIETILSGILSDRALAERLAEYLNRVEIAEGTVFMTEGETASDIYFIERGTAEVIVGTELNQRAVRTLGPGSIAGEIAYFRGGIRTTTLRASEPIVAWVFSADTARRVLAEDPVLSSRFHAGIAAILAERVNANTRLVQMLRA